MKYFFFLILLFSVLGCCIQLSNTVQYFDNNTAVRCRKCCIITSLHNDIEYLDIIDWNCSTISEDWNFPHLKTLTINSNKIQFPSTSPSSELEIVSILDPMLDSIPSFIYETEKLEELIVFLYSDKYLDNENLATLKKLKWLKIGLSEMSTIPNFIYALDSLEELVIFSNNPSESMVFNENLLQLKNLKILEVPIDLKENLELLSKLPNLKKLKVKSFSALEEEKELITKLSHLKEFCIEEMLPNQRPVIVEIIPKVDVSFCDDWHIMPLNWGKEISN